MSETYFIRGAVYVDNYGKKWKARIRRSDKQKVLLLLGKFGGVTTKEGKTVEGLWDNGNGLTLLHR